VQYRIRVTSAEGVTPEMRAPSRSKVQGLWYRLWGFKISKQMYSCEKIKRREMWDPIGSPPEIRDAAAIVAGLTSLSFSTSSVDSEPAARGRWSRGVKDLGFRLEGLALTV